MDSLRNILITGADGFLGSHLTQYLKTRFNIIGLVKNSKQLVRLDQKSTEYVLVSDEYDLEPILRLHQIDCIIHTATLYKGLPNNLSDLIETNVLLPIRLIQAAVQTGIKAFINTDSFYNDAHNNCEYLSDYTLSKRQVNEWLKFFINKMVIVNLKLQHIFGPGDNSDKFVPSVITDILSGTSFLNTTPGEQRRDFIFIRDVVSAYEIVLDNYSTLIQRESRFWEADVGTGKSISLREFLTLICLLTECNTDIRFGALPYREGEIMDSFASDGLLQEFAWKPTYSLKDGLQETIASLSKKISNGK
jgi:nucleoside-diphosphate-sugar epimerase